MAVANSNSTIPPPNPSTLLTPLLPALTAAVASREPAAAVLPLLSPILRQRVQYLTPSSSDPWLRLLCYDTSKAARLAEIAATSLEPHPVSGEVEIDWDYDSQRRYRRLDPETLQTFLVLGDLGLAFLLVYCVGDKDGGGDGWRVGEVTTVDDGQSPFREFGGYTTIEEAEAQFKLSKVQKQASTTTNGGLATTQSIDDVDDDDDDYWARYDATPARTPAQNQSPAPHASTNALPPNRHNTFGTDTSQDNNTAEDDAYYSQYDDVQPAMDNHDPDEEDIVAQYSAPLGLISPQTQDRSAAFSSGDESTSTKIPPWTAATEKEKKNGVEIFQPRPDSSASSNGSHTVAKLEREAGRRENGEFGVKQHISRSIRSLWMLSRSSGIDKEEFERIVRTEIELLEMMGDVE